MYCSGRIILFAGLVAGAGPAAAQTAIGQMAEVVGEVSGSYGARKMALSNGASVVQNEVVSTAAASSARVAFHDFSALSIAAQSSVKLDRFVYNPDATASAASLTLARGAFRFVTGTSPSRNISIKTPGASIGLRGTAVDVLVQPGREIVVLRQGAVVVCKARQCVDVTEPGSGVIVTRAGVSQPGGEAARAFDFDALTTSRFYLYRLNQLPPGGDNRSSGGSPSNSNSNTQGP